MENVVIIGGGIAGLMAAYVASQHRGVQTVVLEPGRPGGEFLSGGLKYIHRTDAMVSMLSDMGAVFTNYTVSGGVLLHDVVQPYPDVLRGMDAGRARRLQEDHWRKTRRTEPDASLGKSMNDPEAIGTRRALRCDAADLIGRLANATTISKDRVTKVEAGYVMVSNGASYPYDYLIVTIPLWVAKQMVFFKLPDALAMRLNVVVVEPAKVRTDAGEKRDSIGATLDRFAKWDYVYTPYTPDGLIHRIYPFENGYACEFNGQWPEGDEEVGRALTSDLNFLWPNGWAVKTAARNLNGHLLPMETPPVWPAHIQPLGRFAQWDGRATADVVLESAWKLAEGWNWKRCHRTD